MTGLAGRLSLAGGSPGDQVVHAPWTFLPAAVYETGRCAEAERGRAEAQREHERQERRRKAVEEVGDPRR